VGDVAGQRGHLLIFLEFEQANTALLHLLEIIRIKFAKNHRVDHAIALTLLAIELRVVIFYTFNDAWSAANRQTDDDRYQNSLPHTQE